MATCGNCKAEGMSIEHVRECYQSKHAAVATMQETAEVTGFAQQYVESRDFKPMALTIPDSKYALETEDGLKFYEVRTGKKGTKWESFQFLDLLVGAPGDWQKYPVKGEAKKQIMNLIGADPKAAAVRYSRTYTICAVCSSPLSDPESVATGLGPICAKRF